MSNVTESIGNETVPNRNLTVETNLYERFFHISKENFIICDVHFMVKDINASACELLCINKEEKIGKCLLSFLKIVSKDNLKEELESFRENGRGSLDWVLTGENECIKHIQCKVEFKQKHYFFVLHDLTLSKKIEKDYVISTKLFKEVFTRVTDGFLILDAEYTIIDVNGAFIAGVHTDRDSFIGRDMREFVTERALPRFLSEWEKIKHSGKNKSTTELVIEGQRFFFDFYTYMNYYTKEIICIFKDVTEKTLIEQELKQSNEILEHVYEQAYDAIVLTDKKDRIVKANEKAFKMFEVTEANLIGRRMDDFILKKDDVYYNMLAKLLNDGAVREELFFLMGNGQKKLLEFTSKKIKDADVNVTIYRNVSERHEMEKKLRKSEKRFRTIFDGMTVGLVLWRDNYIIDINGAGEETLELPKKFLISKTIQEILNIVPENGSRINQMLQKINQESDIEEIIQIRFRRGKKKYLEFRTKKNLVSGMHLTSINDVTEKLELQEQLQKSDTLSVVGELAAGIAHEIRNPMTALKGFIQLLESSITEDFSTYFNIITSELQRIENIITEFLVLAKPQAVQYREKDVNLIVQETIDLLHAEALLCNVIFVPALSPDALMLYCEPNQLKQVFINILKNAIESMKKGGCIRIVTELNDDQYMKVSITDEGGGISSQKLKKLGEPFYTTKERGTGLGLMVSYKIIEEHGGKIEVESELGKGSTFHLYLPREEEPR